VAGEEVCAVICGTGAADVQHSRVAIEAGSVVPGVVYEAADLVIAAAAAAETGRRWTWLVAPGAVPDGQALAELLDVAQGSPPPALLASKPVYPHGELVTDTLMRHELLDKERSVAAAERGLVRLRAAAAGSVLVAAEAGRRSGPPRPGLPAALGLFEWSARLLRPEGTDGYLVPSSVVTLSPSGVESRSELWGRLRLLAGTAWAPADRLWEGVLLARDGRRELAGRVRGARGWARRAADRRAHRAG
jgi:hypothetical protein